MGELTHHPLALSLEEKGIDLGNIRNFDDWIKEK